MFPFLLFSFLHFEFIFKEWEKKIATNNQEQGRICVAQAKISKNSYHTLKRVFIDFEGLFFFNPIPSLKSHTMIRTYSERGEKKRGGVGCVVLFFYEIP